MASTTRCPALCCCRRPLHPGPGPESPQRFQPGPPDPASASSFQLYRLHHFHLGLELRTETRELSGCLVLEISPLVPGGPALVLDIHPVVRVSSVRCRRGGRHNSNQSHRRTSQSCPATDHSAQPCSPRDHPAQPCPPGDHPTWSCPPRDHSAHPFPPGDHSVRSCPPGDHPTWSYPTADHPAQPCPPGDHPTWSCPPRDHPVQPCSPRDHPAQPCSPRDHSPQSSPPGDHSTWSYPPADHSAQSFPPGDHSVQSCPPRDHPAQLSYPASDYSVHQPCPPGDHSWSPEDPKDGCQEECQTDWGLSDSPPSTQTTDALCYATPESSTVSPGTECSVVTPEPLDLSISHSKCSSSLPHVPGDVCFGPDNFAASSAGTGCSFINGHQPLATSLKNSCVSTLDPFTSTSSPTTDLSSHSSLSCYTWSSDSLVSPTPDSGFATSSMPAHFSSMDIPALEDLPCTFSQQCEFHSASDSVPSHSTCCFPLDFRVEEFTDYGSALNITVPETLQTNETFQVIVHYVTGEGPAVWWLDPELSYGSSELFVFTQGHSVCNRSFFPCFDTPAVKCTYSASVKAPAGIRVLMSCTHSYYIEELGTFHFYMEHPVPAYLVALTAGHLLPADIGPRSRVWAEPCVLPLAVGKLAGRVEQWLQAAESLYGPYIWGRYDIVFLPPSFPIVAMENPCLTFVICSILDSEDFLLIDVIHEIAHGWFGNAVTNASWEEMWLSEGLATYAQRRITTLVYGAAFTCLETTFRLEALHRQIRILGQDTPFSRLQAKLDPGVNPSNLMNLFTYEKGFCFVHYLSQLCGDQDNFDAFLRDYIETFKFRSVVANDLLESYLCFFPHLRGESQSFSEGLDFDRWLNAPGPPLTQPDLSQGSVFTTPVEALNQLWMNEPLDIEAAATFVNIADWQTFQTVLFLDKLLDQSPLRPEVMLQLSLCYSSDLATMNTEIRIRWLQIVVRNNFQTDLPRVRHFLLCQTSRMYTIPLYEDLSAGPLKSCALELFCQTHGRLHPNLRKTIQQILAQGGSVVQPDSALPVLSTDLCTQGSSSLRDVNVTA